MRPFVPHTLPVLTVTCEVLPIGHGLWCRTLSYTFDSNSDHFQAHFFQSNRHAIVYRTVTTAAIRSTSSSCENSSATGASKAARPRTEIDLRLRRRTGIGILLKRRPHLGRRDLPIVSKLKLASGFSPARFIEQREREKGRKEVASFDRARGHGN